MVWGSADHLLTFRCCNQILPDVVQQCAVIYTGKVLSTVFSDRITPHPYNMKRQPHASPDIRV